MEELKTQLVSVYDLLPLFATISLISYEIYNSSVVTSPHH